MAKAATQTKEPVVDHSIILREVADKPILLLTDAAKLDQYLAALRADVEANPGDIATAKGRDIIKGNAAEIRRKKAAIEKERLRATEEYRTKTNIVNAAGKVVKERFQALEDEVRAPLTAWEEREEARQNEAKAILDDMRQAVIIEVGATSAEVQERLDRIRGRNLSDETFGPRIHEATDLRDEAVAALSAALERIRQEEADRAELLRLREEREQRARDDAERAEREEREAAEREEAERAEALRVERERADAEAAERQKAADADRIERERQEAAEQAQREAEARAQEERDRVQRVQDAIDAKRRYARQIIQHIRDVGLGMIGGQPQPYGILIRELTDKIVINDDLGDMQEEVRAVRDATLDAVKAAMEREQERLDREEREEQERLERAEQARKEASREHRSKIQREAKEAIMSCGVEEETAKKIVLAILAKTIPHTSITY